MREPDDGQPGVVAAPPAHRSGRRPGADAIRASIVDATIDLIGTGGVAAVTHRAVADRADVSLSSTTYHFASKTAIVEAAMREVLAREIAGVHALAENVAPHIHDIPTLVEALNTWIDHEVGPGRTQARAGYELQLETDRSPELSALHLQWQVELDRVSGAALAAAGSPRPEEDARVLAAFLDGLRIQELANPGGERRAWRSGVIERLLRALITGPPPA